MSIKYNPSLLKYKLGLSYRKIFVCRRRYMLFSLNFKKLSNLSGFRNTCDYFTLKR